MTRNLHHRARFHRLFSGFTRAALVAVFLLSSALATSAQVTEAQASELARKSVLAGLGKPKESFLDVSPVPALQELFARVATEGHGPLPFVFHISDEGVEHKGNVERYHLPVDAILNVVAAVSASGEVYTIREGSNSLPEFNRLANDYHVRLQSEERARKYLAWYLAIQPNFSLTEIRSLQQLKEEAERTIKGWGKSPEEDKATFEAWWKKHEHEATRLDYEEQVARTARGFLVSFYDLSESERKHLRRGPGILRVSVEFSTNGEVGSLRVKKISQK